MAPVSEFTVTEDGWYKIHLTIFNSVLRVNHEEVYNGSPATLWIYLKESDTVEIEGNYTMEKTSSPNGVKIK